ncbi:PREDICTED: coiled-coil domain-containing protein 186-like isoform X2 [Camelina sativa]|uniref:Coiled-coil domain-containing protein 186-like isoform X2 n=1 Tax=Camelina sativa TaxID=90675 RepID=A0ABM1QMH1_CAMSA|nr:PREDICTED: coiled-coil domain-containing protein 186-like isoform X2 [Camelina sativa]
MEEAKAEVEKKVAILLKFIQNKNKIPKVTKKELVGIVEDLHGRCRILYSVFDDFETNSYGRKAKLGTASSSRSSSDLDYYSSEEIEISSTGNVSSDYAVMLQKLQETQLRNEDLERQVSNLKQETSFLRDQNLQVAGDIEGKRNEDREHFKGLMTKSEAALLRNQKKELELKLEDKTNQVSETQMRLKRLAEEAEKQAKAEMKIVEEKEALLNKVQKLEAGIGKKRKKYSEEMKCKITEIDRLKEENQKLHTRIAEINEIEDKSKKLGNQVSDQHKLDKEQEDIIQRLSIENNDQNKLLKEQKDVIDKSSEDQKLLKRWSFGGSKLNTNLLERKMEELAEDFRMKMEDHIRILYRRIHVAEQIHVESKNNYIKTRDNTQVLQENRGNREDCTVSESQFKKIKEMVEKGLAGPEMAIKKLEESGELVSRVTRLAKDIDSARKLVKEKDNKMKHEVETLEAKLECREAQECLLKEKLSKLEAKLAEEGTGKLSLAKAMRKIKKLEIDVREKEFELLSLGEGKREAIRQLCVLVDYQRCRYDDLKTSIFNVALQA